MSAFYADPIKFLALRAGALRAQGHHDEADKCDAAIALLEAAGKIGEARQYLIDYITEGRDFHQAHEEPDAAEALNNLLSLLSAPPDGRK